MTDDDYKALVARLRDGCVINRDFNIVDVDEVATDALMIKSADAIEALMAERERAADYGKQIDVLADEVVTQDKQIDKLREALVKARNATNFEERMRALAAIDAVLAETKEDGNERLHGRV